MNIQLSFAMAVNPRARPILDGTVKPEGIDLVPTPLHPSEIFWRQLRFADQAIDHSLLKAGGNIGCGRVQGSGLRVQVRGCL